MGSNQLVEATIKPTYRGVLHSYAFFAAIPAALHLIINSGSRPVFWSMVVYSISLLGLLGTSSLYHRLQWTPNAQRAMGTLDRTMIYCFIAGTFTPFAVLAMTGLLPVVLLSFLWGSVLLGAIVNVFWFNAPRWVHSALYLAISWAGIVTVPQLWTSIGPAGLFWMVVGGLLYSVGGIVYALKRPDPLPRIFGFHEIFHVFVTVGVAVHYAVISQYLITPF